MPTRNAHPSDDKSLYTQVTWRDYPIQVKKKFPMFGFMRALDKNPIEAMGMILSEESLEMLNSIDMDFADLNDFISTVSKALGADDGGN